jgi:hypothetical protein
MMKWKRCGRELSCHNLRYYLGKFLEELRKTTKTSVKIAGVWAEIWTRDLSNMKQE